MAKKFINMKPIQNEIENISDIANITISITLLIDNEADEKLSAHVRNLFLTSNPNAKVSINYFDDGYKYGGVDDCVFIVAGTSAYAGRLADEILTSGIPVFTITHNKFEFMTACQNNHIEISSSDCAELSLFTSKETTKLNDHIGGWICAVLPNKETAFARTFNFVAHGVARDCVMLTTAQNAAIGALPIIPGADFAILTANQVKMLIQIAGCYGHDISKDMIKEIGAILVCAFGFKRFAGGLKKFIPVLGPVIGGGVAGGGTYALGVAIIEYFDAGGNIDGLSNVVKHTISGIVKVKNSSVVQNLVK